MVKTCILTGFEGDVSHYTYTISSMVYYSNKINADFIEGIQIPLPAELNAINTGKNGKICLKKLYWIRKALEIYDRVLWVDSACFINPNTPNLFEIVPTTHIGAPSQVLNNILGFPNVCVSYLQNKNVNVSHLQAINNNILVFSKCHSSLLSNQNLINHEMFNTQFGDLVFLNEVIHTNQIPIAYLEEKYCRISITKHNLLTLQKEEFVSDLRKMKRNNQDPTIKYNLVRFDENFFQTDKHIREAFVYYTPLFYTEKQKTSIHKNLLNCYTEIKDYIRSLKK
jgi:hypothetical protein